MIKPIMNTRFALPFVAAGAMFLGSCNFTTDGKLHDYMEGKECSQAALDSVLDATKRDNKEKEAVVRQSTVDSMAYRDLFNTTNLVNDSAAIAELNKIAAKASLEKVEKPAGWHFRLYKNHIHNTAVSDGISITEADKLRDIIDNLQTAFMTENAYSAKLQAYSDMYFYGKFFREKGLFDDEDFGKNFEKTAKSLDID